MPNIAYLAGLDFDDDGRAAAPVDVDGDGDLDLVLFSLQGLRLVENTAPPRSFARVRVLDRRGNPALNAVVRLSAGGVAQQDCVRVMDGFAAQVPSDLHFGLAGADRVDRISVTWPDGSTSEVRDLPARRLLTLRQGEAEAAVAELRTWKKRRGARPAFSFATKARTLEGGEAPLAEAGLPVVVNFWSPTCAPCKEEMPALGKLAAKWAGAARFAGVSVEAADLAAVRDTARALGAAYPHFLSSPDIMRAFFGNDREAPLPSTFVFDRHGALKRVFRRTVSEGELDALLASLGDEPLSVTELDQRGARENILGRPKEAVALLRRALALDPDRPQTRYHLGVALAELREFDEALMHLRRSAELDPGYWSAHFNIAAILHNRGDFEGAVRHYQEALRLRGEDNGILLSLASSAAAANKVPLAMDCFERAVRLEPRNPTAWGAKGQFHYLLGQVPQAKECFAKALDLDPNEPNARAHMKEIRERERAR
jgi:tetratricopeptide (TPR) repeat protein